MTTLCPEAQKTAQWFWLEVWCSVWMMGDTGNERQGIDRLEQNGNTLMPLDQRPTVMSESLSFIKWILRDANLWTSQWHFVSFSPPQSLATLCSQQKQREDFQRGHDESEGLLCPSAICYDIISIFLSFLSTKQPNTDFSLEGVTRVQTIQANEKPQFSGCCQSQSIEYSNPAVTI